VDPLTGETRKVAVESGSAVEWTEEENYKFRLSAFQDRLVAWLEAGETSVHPPWLRQELLSNLRGQTLPDLSVSRPRSRLTWGIPVPGDEAHTIYVWVDALTNYLTVLGYPWAEGQGTAVGWPADVHVVGKDIVRYAPTFFPHLFPR
jgi:methionyl-tRNA synthetase